MSTLIESIATAILLIFVILLFTHLINGTATEWVGSKFKAAST